MGEGGFVEKKDRRKKPTLSENERHRSKEKKGGTNLSASEDKEHRDTKMHEPTNK